MTLSYTPTPEEERAYRWYAQRQLRKHYRKAHIQYRLARLAEAQYRKYFGFLQDS